MSKRNEFEILAIIPARGGSKTIPRKNIKPILGKPLIAYTIEESKKSRYINRIILSTDDEEIAILGKKLGAEVPFLRPSELAEDHVPDLPVFQHCLNWLKENDNYKPDIVVHLRPTAPLRKSHHIEAGIELLLKSPGADSVRSVTSVGQHPLKMWKIENSRLIPFIPEKTSGIKESYNMPRQELPEAYIQNGSVDVIWTNTILEKNSMCGDIIVPFVMEEWESINIDNEIDFSLAELIMKR
jgi:N-acylneuraminate cytidylyltransferase